MIHIGMQKIGQVVSLIVQVLSVQKVLPVVQIQRHVLTIMVQDLHLKDLKIEERQALLV